MNKIISIQLDYLFDKYPTAAVHRNGKTNIYVNITPSSWDRIMNTVGIAGGVKGIIGTEYMEFTYK